MSDTFSKGFLATLGVVTAFFAINMLLLMLLCGGCGALFMVGEGLSQSQKAAQQQQERDAREARIKARREVEKEDVAPDNPEDPFD